MPDSPVNQVPPATPSQPPLQPPPYQPVAAPPPKKGLSALQIVLIIVAIFVGLGIIGAGVIGYGIYRVSKAVHVSSNSSPMTESDLGVAIYPGATQGKANLRMTLAGKNMVTASYLTSDAKDKVIAFYQAQLGSAAQATTTANGATFVLHKGSGETVTVTITQMPNLQEGSTQIMIIHATNAT